MRKRGLVLFLIIFIFLAPMVEAGQYDWVLGGAIGYLSSYSNPAVFFNAAPGTQLLLAAIPVDYSSTTGFCGLARLGDPSTLIVMGYSDTYLYTTVVADDLHMFLCVKTSGPSDDMLLVAADKMRMGESSKNSGQSAMDYIYPQELIDRLQDAMMGIIQQ